MYTIKEEIDLSLSGQITDIVSISNNALLINDVDTVKRTSEGWYINNVYQGKGAMYNYTIDNPTIVNIELFSKVFEEVNEGAEK